MIIVTDADRTEKDFIMGIPVDKFADATPDQDQAVKFFLILGADK